MTDRIVSSDFYVYVHSRLGTGIPFYVGKGRGYRVKSANRNQHWKNIVAKDGGFYISTVAYGIDEEFAFLAEIELIDRYRRLGVKLTNRTDGGDGPAGMKHTEEYKRKKSLSLRGNKHSLGKRPSNETREKLSAARMGNKNAAGSVRTAEEKEHLRKLNIGNTHSLGVPISAARKQQISAFFKGHKYCVGRPQSVETREKRSKAMTASWALRRGDKPISERARRWRLAKERGVKCPG